MAHGAILHSLLQLLILELGRIEGRGIRHEGGRVEHASSTARVVEVVEASAIVVLDSGVVHPGAHVRGNW